MSDFAENSQEHDVDALVAQAYGQEPARQETSPAPAPQAPPAEQQYKEYEFNHRGQPVKIKENDPRMIQWMQQGYDYSQNINTFRGEREAFDKQRQDWEKQWTPYREVDEYARQNPEWWSKVEQGYQEKQQNPYNMPPELKQYLDPIIKDYGMVKDFAQEFQKQQVEKQVQAEDAQLAESIKSIQTRYKDLDFSAKDDSGLSLEQRVLNHAVTNGFPTFRASFLDYYHDHLETLAESRGKELMMQESQKAKKLGLLDSKQASPAFNRTPTGQFASKPKSWSDPSLSSENILKEFKF